MIAYGILGNPGPHIAQDFVDRIAGAVGSECELRKRRKQTLGHVRDNPRRIKNATTPTPVLALTLAIFVLLLQVRKEIR